MARTRNAMINSSSLPSKRRRTKGSFEMRAKQVQIAWPPKALPVEIFHLIIEYLPRSTVQNMRCVNKEFEQNVSAYLFRVVVVPFKPEIYGITPEPTLAGTTDTQTRANQVVQGAVMLQDKGMRVFQGFGTHIRKFAMSFEFDENKLASPPTKCEQEAIKAFWGIYRWPFKSYNRYTQLEGLEQTADETRTMAKALRFIDNAHELGLSIDGGLGWLSGPDTNQRVIDRGGKVLVFGESRFVTEAPKTVKGKSGRVSSDSPSISGAEDQHSIFRRMLRESGLSGAQLEAALQMMQDGEHMTERHYLDLMSQPDSSTTSDTSSSHIVNHPFSVEAHAAQVHAFRSRSAPNGLRPLAPTNLLAGGLHNVGHNAREAIVISSESDGEREGEAEGEVSLPSTILSKTLKSKYDPPSLRPNDLTTAQREMLLETEWAQRAFMQSYAIAIIDNPTTFKNIEALTIARIPSRHLPILRREDFWDGLPQLKRFSLAVIPDWRDIVKLPTSWVEDISLAPSLSVNGVFKLLQDQVSCRKNIKTLHFEWLSGGEEAPGLFARNQQILPAPLVPNAMQMINRVQVAQLLTLPHIEHLSLKNCYITPHMLVRFGLALKKESLQSFTFDSVSLTAPLATNAHPTPLNQAAAGIFFLQPPAALALANMPLPAPAVPALQANTNSTPGWVLPPRSGSWAALIDALTPGNTLAQIRYSRNIDLYEPEIHSRGNITTLDFKSCGYVRLPLDFDQSALDPIVPQPPQPQGISKRIGELESQMMKSHDCALGVILNYMCEVETQTLENAFNMEVGWGPSRAAQTAESITDGITHPGQGRFSGTIWEPRISTANGFS